MAVDKPKTETIIANDVKSSVTWRPWLGIILVVATFFAAQILASLVVSVYPWVKGWSQSMADNWLSNSIMAQFVYIAIAEGINVYTVYWFLKRHGGSWRSIGLNKPHWRDLGFGIIATPVYIAIYFLAVGLAVLLFPSLNINQHQNVGFSSVHGLVQLTVTFISLAVLAPLTEEILFRGLLYGSFRKLYPMVVAAVLTSLLFASAHLPEGGSGGPLYIAAIDTFVLSLVLTFLRDKTGSLWSSITLHFIKNSIAFASIYVFIGR
jgi:membrane protease YdiL (CAAX protease family)